MVSFVLWHSDKVEGTCRTQGEEYLRNVIKQQHADDFSSGYNTTIHTLVWLVGACSCQHFACPYEYFSVYFTITPSNSYILPGWLSFYTLVSGYAWQQCARPHPRVEYITYYTTLLPRQNHCTREIYMGNVLRSQWGWEHLAWTGQPTVSECHHAITTKPDTGAHSLSLLDLLLATHWGTEQDHSQPGFHHSAPCSYIDISTTFIVLIGTKSQDLLQNMPKEIHPTRVFP